MDSIISGNVDVAIMAAVIGSILIIVNEWFKVWLERRKQRKKFAIWDAMEQGGVAPSKFTLEDLASKTHIDARSLKSLLYEMIQEGTVVEGELLGTFTRSKLENANV